MEKAVYRIIDANFNRAREAARVAEDFCRFYLNSRELSSRLKQLRHQLSRYISTLDGSKLVTCRDTESDVGVGSKVEHQMSRGSIGDTLTAACKRLPEALRTLTEVIGSFEPKLAEKIEVLRYQAYTLEKDIVTAFDTFEKFRNVALYVVITSDQPANLLSMTAKCIAGGADCIQMRTKRLADDQRFEVAYHFTQMCGEGGVVSIINDRPDIAIAAGADGVHVGQNDIHPEQIRKLASYPLIIGKSTHSPQQLRGAISEKVGYVGLGPVFATATKPGVAAVGLEYVEHAAGVLRDTSILHTAIGGINADNVDRVVGAGARCICVCSAVTAAADPVEACKVLKGKILA